MLTALIKKIFSSALFKSAGIYAVSRVINSAIPFLMMPVLTRYLTPVDYGIVAMFSILTGFVTPFVGLNLHGAINVRYFNKKETDLPRYVGNCFIILFVSALSVSLIFYLFSTQISSLSSFPRTWLWSVIVVTVSNFASSVLMTLWQAENKAAKFSIFQNAQTFVNLSLSILFVVVLRENWRGRINAQIITAVIFSAVAWYVLYSQKRLSFKYDRVAIRNALRFGLPLIPHALGGMLIFQTDRILLANMTGLAVVGVYTIGFQFGSIVELLGSSFNQAYAPWLYQKLSVDVSEELKVRIVKLTYLYFAGILLFAGALSFIIPWVFTFFVGKNFVAASQYVFWIALGYAFSGMYYMVANYIYLAEKTAILAWITFSVAILNLPVSYALIKLNGPVGAAQASALVFFIFFVMTWIFSARVYKMPWRLSYI